MNDDAHRKTEALLDHAAHAFDAGMAALEAAKEEVRETIARHLEADPTLNGEWYARRVRATPLAATPLAERIAALEAWQLAVADGLGFANRAEGQSGYEVARPAVIVAYVKGAERDGNIETVHALRDDVDALTAELDLESALVGQLQDALAAAQVAHHETARERDEWQRDALAAVDRHQVAHARAVAAERVLMTIHDHAADPNEPPMKTKQLITLTSAALAAKPEGA